jgi:NADPH-dependent curcumin reductase CurA
MTERINRQWLLASRPVGMVSPSDFEFKQESIPELSNGQYLVRNLYISLDPTMRGWMEDRESYMPPVSIGEVMRCSAVGQVIESKNPGFVEGDIVSGLFGMQEYAVAGQGFIHGAQVPDGTPLTWPLGVAGLTGMTAYFGLLELGKPVPGETVLVSGAAGATGSVAAQIAKLEGCRVVGIAGGPEKCALLTDEFGLDGAIDYKADDVERRIKELCPDGVNVYFDNVGGSILEAALANLAKGALQREGTTARTTQSDEPGDATQSHGGLHHHRLRGALSRGRSQIGQVGRRGEDRPSRGYPGGNRKRARDLPALVPRAEYRQAAVKGRGTDVTLDAPRDFRCSHLRFRWVRSR